MKYRCVIITKLLVLSVFIVLPPAAQAATNRSAAVTNTVSGIGRTMDAYGTQQGTPGTPGGIGSFVETILVLLLFALGVYGVFRFIQKKRGMLQDDSESIIILANNSLGNNRALQIVRVGTRAYLIGVAENSISLISEITEKEVIDRLSLQRESSTSAGSEGFMEKLFSVLGREGRKPGVSQQQGNLDFLKSQRDRLQNLKK